MVVAPGVERPPQHGQIHGVPGHPSPGERSGTLSGEQSHACGDLPEAHGAHRLPILVIIVDPDGAGHTVGREDLGQPQADAEDAQRLRQPLAVIVRLFERPPLPSRRRSSALPGSYV